MVTKMCAIPFLNDLCLDMPQPAASTEMKGPLSHYASLPTSEVSQVCSITRTGTSDTELGVSI